MQEWVRASPEPQLPPFCPLYTLSAGLRIAMGASMATRRQWAISSSVVALAAAYVLHFLSARPYGRPLLAATTPSASASAKLALAAAAPPPSALASASAPEDAGVKPGPPVAIRAS